MKAVLCVCVILCLSVLALGQPDPDKPTWPNTFNSTFGLNVNSSGIVNETSYFYSDWTVKAQLITYPTRCIPFNTAAANQACQIWFLPAGATISIPAQKICCLWFPGVGAVPPNFLAPFNYSGQIENVPDMYGKLHATYVWEGSGFLYWTDVKTGDDIQFRDGPGDTFWNFANLIPGKQPASLWQLPANCTSACPSSIRTDQEMLRMAHPFHEL